MYHILICDDEVDIVNALKLYLSDPNYTLHCAYTGEEALDVVRQNDIHLVLMDVMMPRLDGISAMVKLRETSNVPVILLTAKGEASDKIMGLQLGADDYITKPFLPMEVVARVKSQLRRYLQLGGGSVQSDTLTAGGITMDDSGKAVTLDGEPIQLTPTEYAILRLFLKNPGQVFSPKEIYTTVWQESFQGSEKTVAVHIRHLREKLEINPADPRYIKVVWGQGYKLEKLT